MQKGFTLIELAIVLVIIGLLAGGILAAQSLIDSARTRGAITEMQQFDSAVNNFQSKYNGLPGDSPAFGGPTYGPGNGDGMILDDYQDSYRYTGEIATFWVALNKAGFDSNKTYQDEIINSAYNSTKESPNFPTSRLGKNCSYLAYTQTSEAMNLQDYRTTYFLSRHGGSTNDNPRTYACLTIKQAYTLDLKIDDGIATTGNVTRGPGITTTGNGITLDGTNPTIPYDLSISTISATLRINIGAQAGNLN